MRTFRGRVVYDRKEHPFSYKDLIRIATKMREPANVSEFTEGVTAITQILFSLIRSYSNALPYYTQKVVLFPIILGIARGAWAIFKEMLGPEPVDPRVQQIIDGTLLL